MTCGNRRRTKPTDVFIRTKSGLWGSLKRDIGAQSIGRRAAYGSRPASDPPGPGRLCRAGPWRHGVELQDLEHHAQIIVADLAATTLGLQHPFEQDHESQGCVEIVGQRFPEGFDVVVHVKSPRLLGPELLQNVANPPSVLRAFDDPLAEDLDTPL